jgi:predicted nucleotidyltransferase
MKTLPLEPREAKLLADVFRAHPEISEVRIFGSRAKGTHKPESDVDLALWGNVSELGAEAIAAELDELPLPYRFDVLPFDLIKLQPLREHIERVGIRLYPENAPSAF